ncbi:unnamed protein product [Citrullus colocynthis]|uniref:Disease resistance protein RPS4B/Roq1-like leucine-rich repeats domain-containing protein n=1 Tax=Citrullus colocynthis TaxID=252529 RepID=A0ABP0Z578_9ROSI
MELVSNLPSSIESLTGLTKLKLSNCKKLVGLPNSICNLKRLEKRFLSGCENLQHLPGNIGNLESLSEFYVDGTSIKHVPSSILYLKNTSRLSFGGCIGIINASSSQFHWLSRLVPRSRSSSSPSCMGGLQLPPLGGFQNLTSLCLSNCNLVEAPSGLHNLPSLSELDLSGNNFVTLPQTIFYNLSSLSTLELSYCTRLRSLPDLPPSLHTLLVDECTSLESITSLKSLFGGTGPRSDDKKLKFANCLELKTQGNILESLLQGVHLVEKEGQELYDLGEGDMAFHSDINVHFRLTSRHDSENIDRSGFHFLWNDEPWPKNCNHIECFFRFGGYFDIGRAPVKVKSCAVRLVYAEEKTQTTFLLGSFGSIGSGL